MFSSPSNYMITGSSHSVQNSAQPIAEPAKVGMAKIKGADGAEHTVYITKSEEPFGVTLFKMYLERSHRCKFTETKCPLVSGGDESRFAQSG